MSNSTAKRKAKATGVVPDGFVKLDSGEIIPRHRLGTGLREGKEDPTLRVRQDGTAYRVTEKGAHVRLGEKKLSKAERKLLKRIKRDARQAANEQGEPANMTAIHKAVKSLLDGSAEFEVKPAPVRRLTPEAREQREDFEITFGTSGTDCTCFQCAPCSFCTHPGNPHNQEDASCWIEAVPEVVTFDPTRTVLSGEPSPFAGFVLEGCVGCEFCDRCVNEEAVLRHYVGCGDTQAPAMDVAQREWCLKEIDAVEGWSRDDYEAVPDKELAKAVLGAWGGYARDKGAL